MTLATLLLASCATLHDHEVKGACSTRGDNYVRLNIDGTLSWNGVELRNMDEIDRCLKIAVSVTPIARVHFSIDPGTSFESVSRFLREVQRKAAGLDFGFTGNYRPN